MVVFSHCARRASTFSFGSFTASVALLTSLLLSAPANTQAGPSPLYWTNGSGTTPSGTWGTDAFWLGTDASHNVTTNSTWDLFVPNPGDTAGSYTITVNGTQQASSLNIQAGTATFSGGTISVQILNVAGGSTVNLNSTLSGANGTTIVGSSGNGSSIATLSLQGNVTAFPGIVQVGVINPGVVNQTAGVVIYSFIDVGAGSSGTYNLSAGSLSTVDNTANNNGLLVGDSATGNFNLSGTGSVSTGLFPLTLGKNAAGSYTQTGGTATFSGLVIGPGSNPQGNGSGVVSTLTANGGMFSAPSFTSLAVGAANTATITIGGTAQVTLGAFPTARGAGSTATLIFDGGTLLPAAASSAYMGGLTNAFIRAGGAKFNVGTGNDITVTQALLTDAVSTGGGLTKLGAGTLKLGGASTYTGGTTVNAGNLDFLTRTAMPAAGNVTVAAGAGLALGVGTTGSFYAASDVDALFAGTAAGVTNDPASNVGIDTAAGDFTYATSVASTTRGLVKLGANALTLTGTNQYTGGTTINAGTLLVNGSISGTTTVNKLATLGGTGTTGPVVVSDGGKLAPGSSTAIGTLNTGPVTLTGITAIRAKISYGSTPNADLLNVNGAANLNGSQLLLNFLNFPDPSSAFGAPETFEIVASANPITGLNAGYSYTGLSSTATYAYTVAVNPAFSGTDALGRVGDGNDIAVKISAVMIPEPSNLALLCVGLPALLRRMRRCRIA
jgi:autotransporter-associated beta strand protein